MKQTSGEERRDEDNNGQFDKLSTTFNYNREFNNNSLSTGLETETTMGKTKYGNKAMCVDEIINGVRSSRINDSLTGDLTRMLGNLNLENNKDKLQKPRDFVVQPNENVETRGHYETGGEREVQQKTSAEETKTDNLVTLEAPSFEDAEEGEESEEYSPEVAEDRLNERGPMYGVPSNFSSEPGLASTCCTPYRTQTFNTTSVMPPNFPDYTIHNARVVPGKGPKRGMDETHLEPPKYVRPQDSEIGVNNDSEVSTASGSVSTSGAGSLKTISQVDLKQLSGGTMITSGNIPSSADQSFNEAVTSQDSYSDLFELITSESAFNISPDVSYILQEPGEILEHCVREQMPQMFRSHNSTNFDQQLGCYEQYPLPPARTLTDPFNSQCHEFDRNEQMLQQYQERDKHGSTDEKSEGYGSDFSPLNETHSSPMPYHHLTVTVSPAALHESPPQTLWSPPSSNMSNCSFDSGICSPLPDDLCGYTSHVHSPFKAINTGLYTCDENDPDGYRCRFIDEHPEEWKIAQQIVSEKLRDARMKERSAGKSQAGDVVVPRSTTENRTGVVISKAQAVSSNTIAGVTQQNSQTYYGTALVTSSKEQDVTPNRSAPRNPLGNRIPQSSLQGPTVVTKEGTTSSLPAVNSEGKMAIPQISQIKSTQTAGQMVPLILSASGVVTSILIRVPQNVPPKKSSRLRPIAPKEPTKPVEKATDTNGKQTNITNHQITNSGADQEEKLSNISPIDRKKKEGSLNLARRMVAEASASELQNKDEDGDTCLHVAVCHTDTFMVQAISERLVRQNLSQMVNVQNFMGQTPLYLAVSTNNAEMVQLLIEYGADVKLLAESMTSSGSHEKLAAIHCASTKGEEYLDTLKALVKAPGIDLNQVNSDGHTALNCAILAHGKINPDKTSVNSIPIIQALIHAGADPNLQMQQSGKTALMYALESRDIDLIENTFQLVEPSKLDTILKTQAFDSSSCLKIAESLKTSLNQAEQQRLFSCFKPGKSRGVLGSSS